MNVVNYGGYYGYVEIKSLKIYQVNPVGNRTLLPSSIYCSACDNYNKMWGYMWPRSQWVYPGGWDATNDSSMVSLMPDNSIRIPISEYPTFVFHAWNTEWPRPAVSSSYTYEVEAEVNPYGSGMIQIGADFWTSTGSPSTNIEAFVSDWYCDEGTGWRILEAGK